MLVAEKQLLDANLRNELQVLRRMELKMLVNRYLNVIPAATMIGGFTFTGVVEMDLLDPEYEEKNSLTRTVTNLFHVFAAVALSTAVYAIAVSSIAIILGQRLAIQATATQTARHEKNVKELANKFWGVLFSLMISLVGVVGATTCAIWARYEGDITGAAIATSMFALMIPFVVWTICSLNARLNDSNDESTTLKLKSDKAAIDVSEFRIGDLSSIPVKSDIEAALGSGSHHKGKGKQSADQKSKQAVDERSSLLKCLPPAHDHS